MAHTIGEARSVPQTSIEKMLAYAGEGAKPARDALNKILHHRESGYGLGNLMFDGSIGMLEDMSWGKSPILPSGHGFRIDPRMVDLAGIAAPAGLIGKKFVKEGMKDLFKAKLPAQTQLGAIIRTQKDFDDLIKKGYDTDNWYHGSNTRGIEEFDINAPKNRNTVGDTEGLYITSDKEYAHGYIRNLPGKKSTRGEVYQVYHKLKNPLDITDDIRNRPKGMSFGDAKREALKKLDRSKHDGVVFDGDYFNPPERTIFDLSSVHIKDQTQNIGRKYTKKEAQDMFDEHMETDTETIGDYSKEELFDQIHKITGHDLGKTDLQEAVGRKAILKLKKSESKVEQLFDKPDTTFDDHVTKLDHLILQKRMLGRLDDFAASNVKKDKFLELGDLQRGKPEQAMLELQRKAGGGVLGNAAEHIGDITHRMTHMLKWGDDDYKTGYEFVENKVGKMLRTLKNPYGFKKEMDENLASNAEFYKKPEAFFRSEVDMKMKNYAYQHEQLPVYNEAQRNARDAAVSLGKGDFKKTITHLEELQKHLGSPEEWHKYATKNLEGK